MPEDYHDIQLPRVARQITLVRGVDERRVSLDGRPEAVRYRIGRLVPFTGILDTQLGGGHWRFLTLSYLLAQPLTVTERTEYVRELHHHHSTQQAVERRETDTRREADSPATRRTRSHPPRITRLVAEQFPRPTYLVSRYVEERGSGVTDRERKGLNRPTAFGYLDRTERDERPARAPLKGSSGPWRAPTLSGRWVYRRARADDTVTESSRTVGERRAPGSTWHDSEGRPHEKAGQETDTRPPGSVRYDRRTDFETGLSIRRLPPRIHRRAQSPVGGVRTGAPQPSGRDSLRVVRTETARIVQTNGPRAVQPDEPRTVVQSVHIDSDSGREGGGQGDGSAQPVTHLQRQVARRRDRLGRPDDYPTVDHGRATRALRGLNRRADDPHSFEVVTRFQDTRPRPSDTETGQQSPALAPADNPSERRVREVLREVSSGASGLPGLETVVSPPREAVERIETRRGPPTVMRETRLQLAAGGTAGPPERHGSERGASDSRDESRLRQQSPDAPTQKSPRSVVPAPPPTGDTVASDRPRLVHRRERHLSDGERPGVVAANERASPGRTTTQQRPATAAGSTPEPDSSQEQYISALEALTDRHMAADPTIDRLVDHLFNRLERKLRIERERRGR